MHKETGQIKEQKDLTSEELKSGKWVEVNTKRVAELSAMSAAARVALYEREERDRPRGVSTYFNATIKPPAPSAKRKDKRKAQRAARKRNRK